MPIESAFQLLYALHHRDRVCRPVIAPRLDELAAVSDGPIRWDHGRGLSGLVAEPSHTFPERWSSGHEMALSLLGLAISRFFDPLKAPPTAEQLASLAELLSEDRRKALAMSLDEAADVQERIRRERAKLLEGEPDEPLIVTYEELHRISLRLVAVKTMQNKMSKDSQHRSESQTAKKGKVARFRYSDVAAWWLRHWPETPLPIESEARKRLRESPS